MCHMRRKTTLQLNLPGKVVARIKTTNSPVKSYPNFPWVFLGTDTDTKHTHQGNRNNPRHQNKESYYPPRVMDPKKYSIKEATWGCNPPILSCHSIWVRHNDTCAYTHTRVHISCNIAISLHFLIQWYFSIILEKHKLKVFNNVLHLLLMQPY